MYELLHGDALAVLRTLPDGAARCCVTSPPYWGLRDYGEAGQLGREADPRDYVAALVAVLAEVRRVLAYDGTLWLNLGDSYAAGKCGRDDEGAADIARRKAAGHRTGNSNKTGGGVARRARGLAPKNLVGIPWRVAFALQDAGWVLRSDIIWHKPNAMPSSVRDRPTTAHEYLFLLAKSPRYHYDASAIKEPLKHPGAKGIRFGGGKYPGAEHGAAATYSGNVYDATALAGRNRRSVWEIPTRPYRGAHFATFPPQLVEPCILAGSAPGDTVIDPFCGSGTTGAVAVTHGRRFVGIDIHADYLSLAEDRISRAATVAD